MADVAAKAGVSRTLVSLVLRNRPGASAQTRERIMRAAEQLGYHPDSAAQALARGRSRTLGVMFNIDQPFQTELVRAVYPAAEKRGYDVLLSAVAPGRDERRAADALLGHRCEALILVGPDSDETSLRRLAHRAPTVVIGRRLPGGRADSVRTAEAKGVRQAVDHLVEIGHRRIVHLDGDTDFGAIERRRAYRAAMRRSGLDAQIRVIGHRSGIEAGQRLLGEGDLPTAVLVGDDRCAAGLVHALRRGGLNVPGEVSVIGSGDTRLDQSDLTTVRPDVAGLGEQAVRCAVERANGEVEAAREVVLDPELVVRSTSGPPRITDR